MTDDPTTLDLDDAGFAMQAFEDELRQLAPSRMTPEQQSMYYDRMRSAEHRWRYRMTGMTYREMSRHDEALSVIRANPGRAPLLTHLGEYPIDDGWARLVTDNRHPSRIRCAIMRYAYRLPIIVWLAMAWSVVYGLCRLIGWLVSIIF